MICLCQHVSPLKGRAPLDPHVSHISLPTSYIYVMLWLCRLQGLDVLVSRRVWLKAVMCGGALARDTSNLNNQRGKESMALTPLIVNGA